MGFKVLPQSAGGDAVLNRSLWDNTAEVPPIRDQDYVKNLNPGLQWYISSHFASSASDAAILYGLRPDASSDGDLETLAAGSLGWISGLNPGLPRTKIVSNSSPDIRPWGAAAFIVNAGIPSARGFTSFEPLKSVKQWQFPGKGVLNSPLRERWWIEPLPNGFTTVVNGHVIWDGEWDYWNQGEQGWISGEVKESRYAGPGGGCTNGGSAGGCPSYAGGRD